MAGFEIKDLSSILSLVFPHPCKICGKVDLSSIELSFCKECIGEILPAPLFCGVCGFFVDFSGNCPSCKSGVRPPYRNAGFVCIYGDTIRDVILEFKFHGKRKLAKVFGRVMASEFLGKFTTCDYDYIVPVPLHRQRMSERQFNQSELLALELAKYISVPVNTSILTQPKPTREQVHLDTDERWINICGVYRASRKGCGKGILLIDDVYTTGATTWECSKVLLEAGCLFVDVFTFARSAKFHDVPDAV